MNKLLLLFIVLNIANVMLQTFKTICTVNSGKYTAAISNAVAYGFYTIVVIYMLCDLPIWTKALVVGVCNLIGVYIVKYVEEKRVKDKLWKIEFAVKTLYRREIIEKLETKDIPYNYVTMPKNYTSFYAFCKSKKETEEIKGIINKCGAKYFVSESKIV